ncbi:MAG: tetratricopeptide repeat protein, partial [Desulfamplus sp.]|nr:tetratricopeptide repeat protein [Desulfamplus sp.]
MQINLTKYFNKVIQGIRQQCFFVALQNNPYSALYKLQNGPPDSSLVYEKQLSDSLLYDENNNDESKARKSDNLISRDLNKAVDHYNTGNFDAAQNICDEILTAAPDADSYNILDNTGDQRGESKKNIQLMHKTLKVDNKSSKYNNNLGNLLFEQEKFSEAAVFYRQSIKCNPDYFEAVFNLGLACTHYKNYEEALDAFQKVIKMKPDFCDAYTNIGNIYMDYNRPQEAVDIYRKALKLKPRDVIVSVNLGLALQAVNKTEEAIQILEKSLERFPEDPDLLFNIGNFYHSIENTDKSIKMFKTLLIANPDHLKGLYNLGTTYMNTGQHAKAISSFERVLKLSPNDLHGLNNMGLVHFNIGDFKNALAFFDRAIDLYPDFPKIYNNIALVYKRLEQKSNAMENFQFAIDRDPEFAEAYHNLAEMQRESSMLEEAAINAKKAIELQPDLTPANTHYSYVLKWLCEWDEYDRLKVHIDKLVREEIDKGQSPGESPFMNIIREDDPSYNLKIADFFAKNFAETAKNLNIKFAFDERIRKATNNKNRKITLGYLSSNFRNHPMAHLLCNLFKSHNREQFQVNCYSIGHDDNSEYRRRFMEDADIFRDIRYVGYAESAQLIFDDGVDILIDLMGYTHGSRLEIAALHPAPIQVRYMGMPGTTGGELFDYIIVDEIVLPRDQQKHYAEKFIYMPYTYQINDRSKKISTEPVTREMFNLPED